MVRHIPSLEKASVSQVPILVFLKGQITDADATGKYFTLIPVQETDIVTILQQRSSNGVEI